MVKRYWGPSLNRTFQNVVRILYLKDDRPTFEGVLNVLTGKTKKLGEIAKHKSFKEFMKELKEDSRGKARLSYKQG